MCQFIKIRNKNLFLTNSKKLINNDDICFVYNKNKIVKSIYLKEKVNNEKLILPSAGVVKMSKKTFLKYLNIINKKNLLKEMYYEIGYKELIKKIKFKVFESKKKIIEIDTKKDYQNFIESNYYNFYDK